MPWSQSAQSWVGVGPGSSSWRPGVLRWESLGGNSRSPCRLSHSLPTQQGNHCLAFPLGKSLCAGKHWGPHWTWDKIKCMQATGMAPNCQTPSGSSSPWGCCLSSDLIFGPHPRLPLFLMLQLREWSSVSWWGDSDWTLSSLLVESLSSASYSLNNSGRPLGLWHASVSPPVKWSWSLCLGLRSLSKLIIQATLTSTDRWGCNEYKMLLFSVLWSRVLFSLWQGCPKCEIHRGALITWNDTCNQISWNIQILLCFCWVKLLV